MKGCDICGAQEKTAVHILNTGGRAEYCPACGAHEALLAAAEVHLLEQIKPIVLAWATHWNAAGVRPESLLTSLDFLTEFWHVDGVQGNPGRSRALILQAMVPAKEQV